MRIIYYSPHPHLNLQSPSGYGTHMREMIKAFEGSGCEVLPVIMGGTERQNVQGLGNNEQPKYKQLAKKIVGRTVWRFLKDLNLLRFDKKAEKRLEEYVLSFQPELIYERCYYMQLSGVNVANRHNITHIMEINSPYVEQTNFLSNSKSPLEFLANRYEKKQLEFTDIALTLEHSLKNYFIKKHNIEEQKFLITPDAFNSDNIILHQDKQNEIVNRYQLNNVKTIGYLGSIFEWHGLEYLIKAFDKLKLNNTKLLIVGYGEYAEKLVDLTQTLDRSDDIIFTGMVDRKYVFDYLQVMDICVAPGAEWFQSPIKIFEYGAMGKPVIAPNTGPVKEVMNHGKDGLLVNPNTDSVYQALVRMFNNPEEAERMGKSFQEKVLNDYTWDQNAKKVLKAYRERANHGDTVKTPN